jgi:hypothetical protein
VSPELRAAIERAPITRVRSTADFGGAVEVFSYCYRQQTEYIQPAFRQCTVGVELDQRTTLASVTAPEGHREWLGRSNGMNKLQQLTNLVPRIYPMSSIGFAACTWVLALSGTAKAAPGDTYRVDIYGSAVSTLRYADGPSVRCSDSFDAIIAIVDDQPGQETQRQIDFDPCADQVQPYIVATIHHNDDESISVDGYLTKKLRSCEGCSFSERPYFFRFTEVLNPGDVIDISANDDRSWDGATVDYPATKLSYLKQNF